MQLSLESMRAAGPPPTPIRSVACGALCRIRIFFAARPHLDAMAKRLLASFPSLDRRLRTTIRMVRANQFQARFKRLSADDLPPRAHQIYLDLVRGINDPI
jgi:hypothetical protein